MTIPHIAPKAADFESFDATNPWVSVSIVAWSRVARTLLRGCEWGVARPFWVSVQMWLRCVHSILMPVWPPCLIDM